MDLDRVTFIHTGISEAVERIPRPLHITIAYKPTGNLGTTVPNGKDRVNQQDRSGVVYAMPCFGCDKQRLSDTGKQLRNRLHEHDGVLLQYSDLSVNLLKILVPAEHKSALSNTMNLFASFPYYMLIECNKFD